MASCRNSTKLLNCSFDRASQMLLSCDLHTVALLTTANTYTQLLCSTFLFVFLQPSDCPQHGPQDGGIWL